MPYAVDAALAPVLVVIGRGYGQHQFGTTAVDLLELRHGRYCTWLEWMLTHG
jgi:hypothetical protein